MSLTVEVMMVTIDRIFGVTVRIKSDTTLCPSVDWCKYLLNSNLYISPLPGIDIDLNWEFQGIRGHKTRTARPTVC